MPKVSGVLGLNLPLGNTQPELPPLYPLSYNGGCKMDQALGLFLLLLDPGLVLLARSLNDEKEGLLASQQSRMHRTPRIDG